MIYLSNLSMVKQPLTKKHINSEKKSQASTHNTDSVLFSSNQAKANPAQLSRWVSTLSAMDRQTHNPQACANVADYIEKEFIALGYPVEKQHFQHSSKLRNIPDYAGVTEIDGNFTNVVTYFGPKDATERIVIGAHYDTVMTSPGADDNASGVAGLLELARLLKENNPNLKTRIDLVAYPLEEAGLHGSSIHAKQIIEESKQGNFKVKGAISLEMIGYFNDEKNSQVIPMKPLFKRFFIKRDKTQDLSIGNFVMLIGDRFSRKWIKSILNDMRANSTVPLQGIALPKQTKDCYSSDHASYRFNGEADKVLFTEPTLGKKNDRGSRLTLFNKGLKNATSIPGIMITDTATLRAGNTYHLETDTPEKLDYNRMAQVVEGLYGFIKNQ